MLQSLIVCFRKTNIDRGCLVLVVLRVLLGVAKLFMTSKSTTEIVILIMLLLNGIRKDRIFLQMLALVFFTVLLFVDGGRLFRRKCLGH